MHGRHWRNRPWWLADPGEGNADRRVDEEKAALWRAGQMPVSAWNKGEAHKYIT